MNSLILFVVLLSVPPFSDWQYVGAVELVQAESRNDCPLAYSSGHLSTVDGQTYISGNVNKCRDEWAALDPATGAVGPFVKVNANSAVYPPGKEALIAGLFAHPESGGCHTLVDTYGTGPDQFGIWCGDHGLPAYDAEGSFVANVRLGGYANEIPPEWQSTLGGTHFAARASWNTRTSGSSFGPALIAVTPDDSALSTLATTWLWTQLETLLVPPEIIASWPGITRDHDQKVGGCVFVGDSYLCVGSYKGGDWYGQDTYCLDSSLPNHECAVGQEPDIHPTYGEPMRDPCSHLRSVHKSRNSIESSSAIWIYSVPDFAETEFVKPWGRDDVGLRGELECGGTHQNLGGVAWEPDTRMLTITSRHDPTPVLHRWHIPGESLPDPVYITLELDELLAFEGPCDSSVVLVVDDVTVYESPCNQ